MKTSKQIGLAVVVFIAILIGTAGSPPSAKEKHKKVVKIEMQSKKQCGVTNQQITTYVQGLGHTVVWVRDISGTCNSKVGIENCATMDVYVSDGYIVGHSSASGYCGGSPSLGPDK
jgi:hypothetical protein